MRLAAKIDSETLGIFVRDGLIGVATKLAELRPYVEELWSRLENGEVILGCSTKKQFCEQVLQRTPRAVRYMLDGGNHSRGEIVSPVEKRVVSEMPTGVYRVLYADPPWQYGNSFAPGSITTALDHYPTMSLDAICSMPLPGITDDAVLFLWTTAPVLEDAFKVINAWGFGYKGGFVWDKVWHNVGHYVSVRHEHLLISTRGSCLPDVPELLDSVVSIERTEHSRKPEEFRTIIDKLYPHGSRIELFARGALPLGWHGWGNDYVGADAA